MGGRCHVKYACIFSAVVNLYMGKARKLKPAQKKVMGGGVRSLKEKKTEYVLVTAHQKKIE